MQILGISARKLGGKNTSANYLHGLVLKELGQINNFSIGGAGELLVETQNAGGTTGWGVCDIMRRDSAFTDYAVQNMFPYIKAYSFADKLKELCTDLFDIPYECVWGTNEQKNTPMPHLLWENMPGSQSPTGSKKTSKKAAKHLEFPTEGVMTARQFMQYMGTEVMRKMYGNIWVNATLKKIKNDAPKLAVIVDVRFPNEVDGILGVDGKVIRLTRTVIEDDHESEHALDENKFDWAKFNYIIKNDDPCTIEDLCVELDKIYQEI